MLARQGAEFEFDRLALAQRAIPATFDEAAGSLWRVGDSPAVSSCHCLTTARVNSE
jgi:hypothetical protein